MIILLALLECCCGIDVHRDIIEACILKGATDSPQAIRAQFKSTKTDLMNLTNWLSNNDCFHIAMESTGVYWRPVYEAIEEQSAYYEHLIVVNAHNMRNLPGRKSDVKDAEWIATLLRHGLLEASFVPERIIRDPREYYRLHKSFVEEKARYINANAASKRLKKPTKEIEAAVCGSINSYERNLLKLILKKIDESQEDIKTILEDMQKLAAPYRESIEQISSIPGIDTTSALTITGESSATPQDCFDCPEKPSSWAGLFPRNDESAGKIKSRKTLHGNPYIKSILCQVAWAAVHYRNTNFNKWFWSHQAKLGKKKAIIAVARKILALIYVLLQKHEFYDIDIALSTYQSPA